MEIPIYQVDAFATRVFEGNPAAVCPLDAWLPDELLQAIAMENNLSETAFLVPDGGEADFELRWFTPTVEVDLCGHATLASAHLVFESLRPGPSSVAFGTRSGRLEVSRGEAGLTMDFPGLPPGDSFEPGPDAVAAVGAEPVACHRIRTVHGAPYELWVFATECEVASLTPRFGQLAANVIATAPGDEVDFVSRFFAPLSGVDEDPVTGSAHCTLAPYWSGRLGRSELSARQISRRGGSIDCRVEGERVMLTGRAVLVVEGTLLLPDA